MVMVVINGNAIIMKPIKSHMDSELTRAYQALMARLNIAGTVAVNHILDNKVLDAI